MPNLNLKNFAKIKDSNFDIKDITVFAGKPGTGKSYIMKMLYAINESEYLSVNTYTDNLEKIRKIQAQNTIAIAELKEQLNQQSNKHNLDYIFDSKLEEINNSIDTANNLLKQDISFNFDNNIKNLLISIFSNYKQISNKFTINYMQYNISLKTNNLKVNSFKNKDSNNIGEVIFVETPLILEFKKFMNREEGKTPYHLESLLKILDKDYSFTNEEQDEFIKSFIEKSKKIIKGSIEDSGDSFIFKTNDEKNYEIVNASSGIKSIGLLQYLVTNKALKKGSVLFWEEPEVHLHPTWQLKMIDLFVELMNAGVKIVFSTHSPFMADYLNAKAQREKFSDRISFNLLSEENNIVSNTILNDDNWNLLQSELLDPLEEIMWEYL
ncbi:MAG: hypothetical protein A2513_00425 [Sulfurimonas sp. RIFOXYD12_FULL_33_39]|uniref:AAA family ATPase n=1 Tax=unclassified Sulfurimonas TaxID=2623549 RepID=UPI0008D58B7E|nr:MULTISPECIES: ATP-binding protein [unclassified Sulfurimonas]OHE10794.1 MAG: hypothetical protein A2513_00425 [Sulfurimonas sp. RIFOXYD12_FULL_33_39]OHE13436.1 MAG: hypothetical protein A2530_07755 [Sulfurimonas sp. RIFOXYD2_FULL_34_21]